MPDSIYATSTRKVDMNFWSRSGILVRWTFAMLLAVFIATPCLGQKPAAAASARPGIVTTKEGAFALDVPKGWSRIPDMGLAFFSPTGTTFETAKAWIYLASGTIGPGTDYPDLSSYIQNDVAVFKDKYPAALVQREIPVVLPHIKLRAQIYTFQSGDKDNSYEQVVYVVEKSHVLLFNFSAKTPDVFQQYLPVFRDFVLSYKGSLNTTPATKP
jgi:hypothetical protein